MGSLGQVPTPSIPVCPSTKHGISGCLRCPDSGFECCWGMKAALGARGSGDRGSRREDQQCPNIALSLSRR